MTCMSEQRPGRHREEGRGRTGPRGILSLLTDNPVTDALGDGFLVLLAVVLYGGLTALYRTAPGAALTVVVLVALAAAVAVASWTRPRTRAASGPVQAARVLTVALGGLLLTMVGVAGPVLLVDAIVDAF